MLQRRHFGTGWMAALGGLIELLWITKQSYVVGGTVWWWASENATDALDVLFVDEAGQMSLANVLAASKATKSLVLLQRVGEKHTVGTVEAVDFASGVIDIKKSQIFSTHHPSAIFTYTVIGAEALESSLLELGAIVRDDMPQSRAIRACARHLLLRDAPQTSTPFVRRDAEDATAFAVRAVLELRDSTLAVQGPPGSGKTYAGAKMICELVRAGKRVGITGPSHKVIRNLVDEVRRQRDQTGLVLHTVLKEDDEQDDEPKNSILRVKNVEKALDKQHTDASSVLSSIVAGCSTISLLARRLPPRSRIAPAAPSGRRLLSIHRGRRC